MDEARTFLLERRHPRTRPHGPRRPRRRRTAAQLGLRTLGPRPQHLPSHAAIWDDTVAFIDLYRTIWQISSGDQPLGPKPHQYNDPRRPDWQHAATTLTNAAHQLGRDRHFDRHLRRDLGLEPDHGLGISR